MTGDRVVALLDLLKPHLKENEQVILIALETDSDDAALIATSDDPAWIANRLYTALTQLTNEFELVKEEDKN